MEREYVQYDEVEVNTVGGNDAHGSGISSFTDIPQFRRLIDHGRSGNSQYYIEMDWRWMMEMNVS
jgi:hypothetical protein